MKSSTSPKAKPRTLVVYTPSYACVPFKVVHDSSAQKGDSLKIATKWENKKAEDSDTKIYRVGVNMTNEEFLHFLNGSMEVCTQSQMDRFDDEIRSKRRTNKKG